MVECECILKELNKQLDLIDDTLSEDNVDITGLNIKRDCLTSVISLIKRTCELDHKVFDEEFIQYCLDKSGFDYTSLDGHDLNMVIECIQVVQDYMIRYITGE